jgi:hypothetical protein
LGEDDIIGGARGGLGRWRRRRRWKRDSRMDRRRCARGHPRRWHDQGEGCRGGADDINGGIPRSQPEETGGRRRGGGGGGGRSSGGHGRRRRRRRGNGRRGRRSRSIQSQVRLQG